MKCIVICGSMSASREMVDAAARLEKLGYAYILPQNTDLYALGKKSPETSIESAESKRHGDLIRGYFQKISESDAVLVVNPKKRGRVGYIGGNTFLEIAFAHVLHKPVYLIYDYDHTCSYAAEIEAMEPTVLQDNLEDIIL